MVHQSFVLERYDIRCHSACKGLARLEISHMNKIYAESVKCNEKNQCIFSSHETSGNMVLHKVECYKPGTCITFAFHRQQYCTAYNAEKWVQWLACVFQLQLFVHHREPSTCGVTTISIGSSRRTMSSPQRIDGWISA